MSSQSNLKNYYQILGLTESASLFQIQNAYQKLAAKWHPDKHKQHRKSAQAKFNQIAEAYEVLSDRNKRSHYDELLNKQYSLEDASSTFERFFNEHGIVDQEQQKFFNQHYPNPLNNYYKILGVSKNATLDDIKTAYRKLALKYHPKSNPGNQQAHKKFVQVNQAFNALSDEFKRQSYDNFLFGQMVPVRAHDIFDDFFGTRWPSIQQEFKPIFHKKWSKDLDRMMIDEGQNLKNVQGQTVKSSSVWTNKNGVKSKKTVTTRKGIHNGKVKEETVQQYLFPNGQKSIVKTINTDGKVQTTQYKLAPGQQVPKQLQL